MTPPRTPGTADAARPPRWLLFIPPAIILAVAWLTPASGLIPEQGDVNLYLEKASALASGQIPYRDFPFEYPPFALVPMVVPYLLWPFGQVTLDEYKWLFAGWEAMLMVGLGLVLGRLVRLGALEGGGFDLQLVGIRLAILTSGAALALAWRYDLFPALLVMVALWAALAGRPGLAGVAVAAGVLAKLYPLALIPALAIRWLLPPDGSRPGRFGSAIVVTLLAGLLPFVALAGPSAFAFLSYQALRGLQIESIGGALVLLDGAVRGEPVKIIAPFSAAEVTGPLGAALLASLPVLMVIGFGVLGWVGWRRVRAEREAFGAVAPATVVALVTASLLVLLATSKVFSIQYVVWLVPFAALLPGRRFWLAAVLVGLTVPIHPLLYVELVEQEALPILILNVRNALLVILMCWVIADLRPSRVPPARDADIGDRDRGLARPAGLEPTTFRSAT